jgi:hypothetical protein
MKFRRIGTEAMTHIMYEVAIHHYGRKLITRDGPAQGLLEWPAHCWGRITARPIGLARAKALADAQITHATVQPWMSADVVYDNGKPPLVPEGWYSPDAQTATR